MLKSILEKVISVSTSKQLSRAAQYIEENELKQDPLFREILAMLESGHHQTD